VVRERVLSTVALLGVVLVIVTEALSAFHALTRTSVVIVWLVTAAVGGLAVMRRRRLVRFEFTHDPVVNVCILSIGLILLLTAVTARFSPPNSADAMAYHLPRVVYWTEQASVRFFPTSYLNQIMLQPLAEYSMLHLFLLAGSDRWINLVQWAASLVSIVGVSAIAGEWGASARGQAVAALFCASLPSGILASSGAKNDYVLAMWLVVMVYFALRFTAQPVTRYALLLGAALGLALLTKATAYLFAPWPLLAIFGMRFGRIGKARLGIAAVCLLLIPLALNLPQYLRNMRLSGSPLGFDSAQGDGYFRWRNESFGWKETVSNILRNTSEQLGARSESWNQGVYRAVVGVHTALGIDPNAPATTWRWTTYKPPRNANHEADAPNPWHLACLILILIACTFARDRERVIYAASLACGFAAFCAYLKWQPFMGRLFLPLFVVGAPLASVVGQLSFGRGVIPIAFALFLLTNAKRPLLENWVRPLQGPRSVLHTPRDDQYFSDMSQWGNAETYKKTVELLAKTECRTIGLDITNLQLEYPLHALLRERSPEVRFLHTGVQNASSQYQQPTDAPACAVVCLDCAGDTRRLQLYRVFGASTTIDKFVILLK
jgi:hypothetical protein